MDEKLTQLCFRTNQGRKIEFKGWEAKESDKRLEGFSCVDGSQFIHSIRQTEGLSTLIKSVSIANYEPCDLFYITDTSLRQGISGEEPGTPCNNIIEAFKMISK